MGHIIIFDTTLRDGEQSPGATLNTEEKIQIAFQLEKLGADIIEAGFPIASEDDFNGVRKIAQKIKKSAICALARARDEDIDRAYEALKDAAHPRIHTFISTSPLHLKYGMKKTQEEIIEMARRAVARARGLVDDVEFSAMDASRTDIEYLCRIVEVAIAEGATTINIPDTVGYALPSRWREFIARIIKQIPRLKEDIILSVHCHNDLGLATANSIAAVESGARQVECTINGLGERGGNAALEEIVMTLKTHEQELKKDTRISTREIYPTSQLVSRLTGIEVQRNKAIVGLNAFAHESGIHQDGILKHRETFEIMRAEDVGWPANKLVLGKHSGRHAIFHRSEALGIQLTDEQKEEFFEQFKKLADEKKEIFDEDLHILAEQVKSAGAAPYKMYSLKSWHIETGSSSLARVVVELEKKGEMFKKETSAYGPVEAAYKAINEIAGIPYILEHYGIAAVTRGEDAFGEVTVKLREKERVIGGKGVSQNILEASILAYLDAVNKFIMLEEKSGGFVDRLTPTR